MQILAAASLWQFLLWLRTVLALLLWWAQHESTIGVRAPFELKWQVHLVLA